MKKERLVSLDLLRGADIFLLTVITRLVSGLNGWIGLPDWLMRDFSHPEWEGFTSHDMIMPLFVFMCGAAVPLAKPTWGHVFRRVALLWFLGLIAQGELLTYDLHQISFFNNTLQTIACGYLAAVAVMKIPRTWVRVAIPFVLAAFYALFLHACGDLTPTGNAAVVYEVRFLSLFYPSPDWHPVSQILAWHYTWWPSIPMFAVLGIAGALATSALKSDRAQAAKARLLTFVGVGLLGLGVVLVTFDPCVKHIYTASFTSFSIGVSYLLFAFCYWLADIRKVRRGTGLLTLFGRHSLLAYMMTSTCFSVAITSFASLFFDGLKGRMDEGLRMMLYRVAVASLLTAVLLFWERHSQAKRELRELKRGDDGR